MKDEAIMISEKQAAERYPYSVHWFRRARWAGNGPKFIKMGNHRVGYRVEDLETYFNQFKSCQSTKDYEQEER